MNTRTDETRDDATLPDPPTASRRQLVDRLTAKGWLTQPAVTAAFATVPRHLFAPAGTSLTAAYADDTVVTQRNAAGKATSSISAPWLSLSTLSVLRRPELEVWPRCSFQSLTVS